MKPSVECKCGTAMKVVKVESGYRGVCPKCGAKAKVRRDWKDRIITKGKP